MHNKIIQKIDNLLLKNWDPIGVSDTPEAKDEYSHYALEIWTIIENSNSYENLFNYLWELETLHMGLRGNKQKTELFAKSLFETIKNMKKS